MKSKKPALCLLAAALVLPVGGYVFAIRPTDQKRIALQQDTSEKLIALANVNHSILTITNSQTKTSGLPEAVAAFEAKLPPDGQMDKVLEDIWQLAQANSLQTKTVRTPVVQTSHGLGEQTIEFSVAGDFGGFYQFLLQFEAAKHVMRISKMHVTRAADHDGEVQADITLSIYSRPTDNTSHEADRRLSR